MASRSRRDHRRGASAAVLLALCALAALAIGLATRRIGQRASGLEYADLIASQAGANGIDESLLRAVIWCESRYDPGAVSSVGARGLMQLTEETFEWVRWRLDEEDRTDFDDLFDPETNVRYGAYLLRWLLDAFEGEEATALAAYHAGANIVRQWLADARYSSDGKTLDAIPYADTEKYVSAVLRAERGFRNRFGST